MVFTWTEVKPHLAVNLLPLETWQTAFTSWKMKPFPASFASPWTAPVAVLHWGMWHWVQAQDFQWQPLQWLKLDLDLTTGGIMLRLSTDVTCCWNTHTKSGHFYLSVRVEWRHYLIPVLGGLYLSDKEGWIIGKKWTVILSNCNKKITETVPRMLVLNLYSATRFNLIVVSMMQSWSEVICALASQRRYSWGVVSGGQKAAGG